MWEDNKKWRCLRRYNNDERNSLTSRYEITLEKLTCCQSIINCNYSDQLLVNEKKKKKDLKFKTKFLQRLKLISNSENLVNNCATNNNANVSKKKKKKNKK